MDRVALTENYLAELETAGLSSEELLGALPQNKILNSDKPNGVGLWLARPVFLGGEELGRLSGGDLDNLLSALDSCPRSSSAGGTSPPSRAPSGSPSRRSRRSCRTGASG